MNPIQVMKKFIPLIILLIICIGLFYKIIFFKEVFYYGDNFQLNAPMKVLLVQSVHKGALPLWNPFIFFGMPYFADINLGTLYPLTFLYFFFPSLQALSIEIVIDVFLINFLTFFFLKERGFSTIISLFGSILFAYSGEVFQYINNVTILNEIVFIPLIFLLFERFRKTGKYLDFLFLLFIQALQLISGHPQVSYFTVLFVLLEILYIKVTWEKRMIIAGLYLSMPLFLGAIQLLPFAELILQSNRLSGVVGSVGKIDIVSLISFFFPTFFGSLSNGTWWGRQTILLGYIGIPSLVVLAVGLKKTFHREKKAIFLASISFIIAWGIPFVSWLIPGLIFFRDYNLSLLFFAFYLTFLCCRCLQILIKNNPIISKKALVLSGVAVSITGVTYVICNLLYKNAYLFISLQKLNYGILLRLSQLQIEKFHFIFANSLWQIWIVCIFVFVTLVIFYKNNILSVRVFLSVLIFILGLNLFLFDKEILLSTPLKNVAVDSSLYNQIANQQYRVLSLPVDFHMNKNDLPGSEFFLREAKKNIQMQRGDLNVPFLTNQVSGYSSLVPKNFSDYLHSSDITGANFPIAKKNILDQSSIQFILDNNKLNIQLIPIKMSEGTYIYKNSTAKPRVYFLNCNTCRLISEKFFFNKIVLDIYSPKPNAIVINTDEIYPGWEASEDQHAIQLKPYEKVFRQMEVAQGYHSVVLKYNPLSFKLGSYISIISLCILSAFIFFKRKDTMNYEK